MPDASQIVDAYIEKTFDAIEHDADARDILLERRLLAEHHQRVAESADATPNARTAPNRRPRRRLSHGARLAVASSVAVALLLTGALTLRTSDEPGQRFDSGISVAEAREQAIDSLTTIDDLKAYTYENTWSLTADDGRTYESSYTLSRNGADTHLTRWWRDDFRGLGRHTGIPELVVDDYIYEGRGGSTYIDEPWLLDVKDGWRAPEDKSRPMSTSSFTWRELPDFAVLVEQLEREGLIDARREDNGAVVIEIDRPAGDLAPLTSSMNGNDPIAEFAMGIKHTRSPKEIVHVRLTINNDGDLRHVEAHAKTRTLIANGKRGGEKVTGTSRVEYRLMPLDAEIAKPDPSDVMVVGNILKSRRGETGIAGPLGTLDTLTVNDLRRLRREARHTPNAAYDSWGIKRPTRPPRSYPAVWRLNRERTADARAQVDAWYPIDRGTLAENPSCSPLWPDSRRAMSRAEAEKAPDRAGWRCTLQRDIGAFTLMPDVGFVELEVRIGRNGLSLSQYRPRKR